MKVLHVYKDYFPVLGGIENHLRLLAGRLQRRGIEVTVLVTNTGRATVRQELEGVPVIKAGRLATVASTPLSLALLWEMGRQKPDLVHLHFPYPMGEVAYLLRPPSPRLVITYHSDIIRQRRLRGLYGPFMRRLLRAADRIIVSSAAYRDSSPYLRPVQERTTIIPFGVDLGALAAYDPAAVESLRFGFAPPLLLFVGLFRYYKGLTYLLEAMEQVPLGTLLLVGRGPLEPELRRQVQERGLAHRVAFLGAVPDARLSALYHAADLFLLPSVERSEAFGIAMLEAQACGLPAISTELGTGTSFVNLDGETGLVVAPRDPSALAAAINRLLSDEALRVHLGQQARERVEREFSAERMVERILAVYEEVLAGSAGRSRR